MACGETDAGAVVSTRAARWPALTERTSSPSVEEVISGTQWHSVAIRLTHLLDGAY